MTWLNSYEIEETAERFAGHEVLGPATRTLLNLMRWTNHNSDGWAYWQKPSNAAKALQTLIHDADLAWRHTDEVKVTREQLLAALRPVKAFRTRQKADFEIVDELNVHLRDAHGYLPATIKNMREHQAPGMFAASFSTGEEFSANAADYFMATDDTLLRDSNDEPMVLVTRRSFLDPVQ